MAVGSAPPTFSAAPAAAPPDEYEQFIQGQIERTRFQVKFVDLAASVMLLLAAALALILALAVVDHWIYPLGFWGRFFALLLIAGGGAYFVATRIAVLLLRQINPVYAARTLEQAQPSLKNSLINFLLLRTNRTAVRGVIFEAIERQAAAGLTGVSIEAAVDRSRAIRLAYVLVGLFAVLGAYTIFSPKSPLTTAARILAPWADIAPPSRVKIEDVQPGDASAYYGRSITVSAMIQGLAEGETATLYYTTADGQTVDRPLPMIAAPGQLRYECQLPPGSEGLQQDLLYRIAAGDARTPREYRIEVLPAPSIVVQAVDYEYPAYTGLEPRTAVRQGDLRALEGTKVTIHARANVPIQSAYIELDPLRGEDRAGGAARSPGEIVRMRADGREATGRLTLALKADRRTPEATSYWVRFVTEDGVRSEQPVLHRIEVTPDLPPEVEILTPAQQQIDLPEDGRTQIEVRAIDPDFGLRRVRLTGVLADREIFNAPLVDASEGRSGQAIERFDLVPRTLGLFEGDVVVYWATAEDTRIDPKSGQPAPNMARTPNYRIRIVAPQRPPAAEDGAPPPEESPPEDGAQQSAPQQPNGSGDSGAAASQDGGSEPGDPSEQGGQDAAAGEAAGEGAAQGDPAGAGTSQQGQGGGEPQQGASADPQGTGGQSGGEPQSGGESGDGSQAGGTPGTGAEATQERQPSGQDAAGSGDRAGEGGQDLAGDPSQRSGRYDPSGSEDGDVFDAINRFREQQQQRQASQSPSGQPSGTAERGTDDQLASADGGRQTPPTAPEPGRQGQQPDQADGQSPAQPGAETSDPGAEDAGIGAEGSRPQQAPPQQGDTPGGDDQSFGGGDPQQGTPQGQGGQPQGGDQPLAEQGAEAAGQQEGPQAGEGDSGDSGAGNASGNEQGAPRSQSDNRQRPGENPDRPGGQGGSEEGQSPTGSRQQSRSQGGEPGDRSGGGDQGGGQGANQQGQDSAGSNTAGDEGSGAASEAGHGETSDRPGDGQVADRPTGRPGEESGEGSTSRPDDRQVAGDQPRTPGGPREGDRPGEGMTGAGERQGDPSGLPGDAAREGGSGRPVGGGRPADTDPAPPRDALSPDVADDPNLEYARKATQLALEYLENQADRPDPELLDRLGWSREEMQQFLRRWREMQREAGRPGAAGDEARRELDEALRSLGLRPTEDRFRRGETGGTVGGVEDATRSSPPPEYLEQFRAFLKGTGRRPAN